MYRAELADLHERPRAPAAADASSLFVSFFGFLLRRGFYRRFAGLLCILLLFSLSLYLALIFEAFFLTFCAGLEEDRSSMMGSRNRRVWDFIFIRRFYKIGRYIDSLKAISFRINHNLP